MKIELDRSKAETAFKKVASVNQNNSLPVLNNSLIDFKDGRMIVYGSDTEISILTSFEMVGAEGELHPIIMDTNMIMKTISTLKSETIFLEVKNKDVIITIPKSKKEYSVPIIYEPGSFIKLAVGNTISSISLPGAKFKEILKSASEFSNPNDLRNALRGVTIYFDDQHLKFFGGSASCFNFIGIKSEDNIGKLIVPKTISKIWDLFNYAAPIEICVDETKTNLIIINGYDTYSIRLIDAPVIDADKISSNFIRENRMVIDRESILQSIGRLMVFTKHESPDLDFDFSGDEIVLVAEDTNYRKKAKETIPFIVKDGDLDFQCTINAKYLQQSLRTFSGEHITIMKSQGATPMLLQDDGQRGFSSEYFIAPINKQQPVTE